MKVRQLFKFIFCLLFMVTSCSKSDLEKISEYAQIVEKKDAQTLLDDLYIGADGDIASLGRILNASPSSINRIRKGDTVPTSKFEERIKEVSIYYVQNDQSFSKLRSVLDDEYAWYEIILDFPSHNPFWFWGINIVLILLLAFLTVIFIWPLLIEILIFLVAYICLLIFSPSKDVKYDKYIKTINPAVEQVI
ncbi:hypothetical protein [Riemerella anatipestifer]|uniref:hypothetical protein n=1 Tax=Riemerella anatipestifer TaxID=34085 RepID=UPI00129D8A0B|nr:hypothetical protein [Riemerella anatipestifer]MRM83897.1 hypothetical protein [Riemerella anatipestifer]